MTPVEAGEEAIVGDSLRFGGVGGETVTVSLCAAKILKNISSNVFIYNMCGEMRGAL